MSLNLKSLVKRLTLLLLVILLVTACMPKAKPLSENQKEYIGIWTGEGNNQIVINADGTASYQYEKKDGATTVSRSANPASVEIGEGKLLITGPMGINFDLVLDEKPQTDSTGATFMVVDGVKLFK